MSVATDAAALVKRSRAGQGLPPQLDDPAVLARVAALLAPERDRDRAAGPGLCKVISSAAQHEEVSRATG